MTREGICTTLNESWQRQYKKNTKKRHKETRAGRADAGNRQGVFKGADFKLYADVYGHAKHGLCVHAENLAAAVLRVRV